MCTWIVWISSLSPSKHPRPNHVPIVIVIQSEYLKHSISPRNQSAKHPGCFGISEVVIGPALSKRWRSNRAWKASGIQGRKWLARDHDVVVFKTKVLHFKIENTPIKDTSGKRKFKRMLSFLLWTNESFSLWNCLSRNSTLFLHGGPECLACFEPTKAARFLKTLEVHSVLHDQRKVRF